MTRSVLPAALVATFLLLPLRAHADDAFCHTFDRIIAHADTFFRELRYSKHGQKVKVALPGFRDCHIALGDEDIYPNSYICNFDTKTRAAADVALTKITSEVAECLPNRKLKKEQNKFTGLPMVSLDTDRDGETSVSVSMTADKHHRDYTVTVWIDGY